MARFAGVFFGGKPIAVTIAMLWLGTINSHVLKITDDFSGVEPTRTGVTGGSMNEIEKNSLRDEFFDIVKKLVIQDEQMQGDQPASGLENANGKSVTPNRTSRNENDSSLDPHKQIKDAVIEEAKSKILAFVGRTGSSNGKDHVTPPPISYPYPLPIMPNFDFSYKREAFRPACPIKNEDNLSVNFSISIPEASEDMVLNVKSAELKLYKIPLQESCNSTDMDDPATSKWQETFRKSNITASERVIATKAAEQRMIQITVYKIRNKNNKKDELKKLDTRMVQASLHGVTTWNVTKAIDAWSSGMKRNLKFIITVEDDNGNKLPAHKVFQMRCHKDLRSPLPIDLNTLPSEYDQTAWLNLATNERLAEDEAYIGAASTMNRLAKDRTPSG